MNREGRKPFFATWQEHIDFVLINAGTDGMRKQDLNDICRGRKNETGVTSGRKETRDHRTRTEEPGEASIDQVGKNLGKPRELR